MTPVSHASYTGSYFMLSLVDQSSFKYLSVRLVQLLVSIMLLTFAQVANTKESTEESHNAAVAGIEHRAHGAIVGAVAGPEQLNSDHFRVMGVRGESTATPPLPACRLPPRRSPLPAPRCRAPSAPA